MVFPPSDHSCISSYNRYSGWIRKLCIHITWESESPTPFVHSLSCGEWDNNSESNHETELEITTIQLHQQHINLGICRLARMKGENSPSDSVLWNKIIDRLVGLSESYEFMRELDRAGITVETKPGRRFKNSGTLRHRHVPRDNGKHNSMFLNSLDLTIQ